MKYNKATEREMQDECVCELNPAPDYRTEKKEATPNDAEWWDDMARSFRDEITTLINGMVTTNDRAVKRHIGGMLGEMIGLYKDAVEAGTTIAVTEELKD